MIKKIHDFIFVVLLRSKGKVVIELDFTDGKYKNNPSLIEEEVKKEFDYL